ncbi:MAG: NADH-quinone oxidoreductase subunit L [Lachnospiraceae bacterium]|nr:NADH-quinone oxidoreductase subunit L [Lachnospiraceae bacterium]
MNLLLFLILFPFVMALLTFCARNEKLRSLVVMIGCVAIMVADIIFCVQAVRAGAGINPLRWAGSETHVYHIFEHVIIDVELLLFLLIAFLSIKYQKYYCLLLAAAGTFPVLWHDFFGTHVTAPLPAVMIDNLTIIMCLVVGIVGGIICIYAIGYLHDYHHHHTDVANRSWYFQALLFVFIGAMFGLVTADSLSWIFFFWEITSTVSFLLIGYTRSEEAINNSFRALWMNLLGGCGFTVTIIYCARFYNVSNLSHLVRMGGMTSGILIPAAMLSFAALTKSAQMPFCKWLLGAMVAPTPSSALLHSATMVKAGVYLLLRIAPLMTGNVVGLMVTSIGGFTFFAASLLAISASDGKKVLAYSTVSNLGLITACAGVGAAEASWAGILLLIFHAVSKSLMFLGVGSIENATGSRDIEDMHGLIVKMPRMAYIMTVGICGMFLAPFGMLVAKWAALKSYIDSNNVVLVIFLVFGSATTMFYWGKWLGKIFVILHQSETLRDTTPKTAWFSMYTLTGLVIILCMTFPMIGSRIVQPYLRQSFYATISNVISPDDIRVMLMMLIMIAILPVLTEILVRTRKEKTTMSYMAGVNAGDDRHFIDAFGGVRPSYLSNWYMEKWFGEKRILSPMLLCSAVALASFMIVAVAGTLA